MESPQVPPNFLGHIPNVAPGLSAKEAVPQLRSDGLAFGAYRYGGQEEAVPHLRNDGLAFGGCRASGQYSFFGGSPCVQGSPFVQGPVQQLGQPQQQMYHNAPPTPQPMRMTMTTDSGVHPQGPQQAFGGALNPVNWVRGHFAQMEVMDNEEINKERSGQWVCVQRYRP